MVRSPLRRSSPNLGRGHVPAFAVVLLVAGCGILLSGCGGPDDATSDDSASGTAAVVTGRVVQADGTGAAGATLLVYRANAVSQETGDPAPDTKWYKTRMACGADGRFRLRIGAFPLVQLVAKRDDLSGEASPPVLARPGDDVVLHLP